MARADRIASSDDARWLANRRLPRPLAEFVEGGSGPAVTLARNTEAYDEIAFAPRFATHVPHPRLATTVLDHAIAAPLLVAPMGGARLVHPDGEIGLARAAGEAGTICCISAYAGHPIESIVRAATGPVFFQLYYPGSVEAADRLIDRVRAAGCAALILTIDTPLTVRRERPLKGRIGGPVPRARDLPRLAPQVARHPGWLLGHLRDRRRGIRSPMLADGAAAPPMWEASKAVARRPPIWDDVARAKERFGGPVIVKGILGAPDAARAVAAGADAIVVSNHGGNALDGSPSSIGVLPEVVEAVGGQTEVLLDSGIRRAADVAKALALGARAVLLGRSLMWSLAAAGEDGARRMLELYRDGLADQLRYLGCGDVRELDPSYVRLPRS